MKPLSEYSDQELQDELNRRKDLVFQPSEPTTGLSAIYKQRLSPYNEQRVTILRQRMLANEEPSYVVECDGAKFIAYRGELSRVLQINGSGRYLHESILDNLYIVDAYNKVGPDKI